MEPSEETLNALVEASAKILRLNIEPAWMPTVCMNLAVSFRIAGMMEDVALPDDAEPAPVYEP